MKVALLILGGVFVVATLLPLIRKDHWVIRDFNFPHVQITTVNIVILTTFVLLFPLEGWLNIAFVVVLLGCIIYQSYIIYPYTYVAPKSVKTSKQSAGENSLNLMVTNVLMTNRNAEGCLKIVRDTDPDLLLMVETDRWWHDQMQHLKETYSHAIEYPLAIPTACCFTLKLPFAEYDIKFVVKEVYPVFSREGSVAIRDRSLTSTVSIPNPPVLPRAKPLPSATPNC